MISRFGRVLVNRHIGDIVIALMAANIVRIAMALAIPRVKWLLIELYNHKRPMTQTGLNAELYDARTALFDSGAFIFLIAAFIATYLLHIWLNRFKRQENQ